MNKYWPVILILILFLSCSKDEAPLSESQKNLTIFSINDQHGQLENFAKIKYIVDKEKLENDVLVVCGGDIFSGNPVVDNHEEKGFPIIDVMNRVGFDISVIGNHEFDYGEEALTNRMAQAEFDWVCANVDMGATSIPEPNEYKSITINDLKVCFLGLVETNGKQDATIPSTHPWKVQNISFDRPEHVVAQYADVKESENADLYIALTHLGHNVSGGRLGDFQLAGQFPYFDLIIGGHSNALLDTIINGIPIVQAGNYLNYLGKIELQVEDRQISSSKYELIDLNVYPHFDTDLKAVIDAYNNAASYLNDVIGYSHTHHERYQVGCFFTDAMVGALDVDFSIQNSGGVRAGLDEGEITKGEIFEVDPFNNGTIIYEMSVSDLKKFFRESSSGYYYSGIHINQVGGEVLISDEFGNLLDDNMNLTLGINDYIPAVYDSFFPDNGTMLTTTTAETLISYLQNDNSQVNYPTCQRFFRFQ